MCLLQVLLSKLIFHIPSDTAKYKAHPLRFLKVASCIYQVYHADLSGSLGKLNLSLNRTAWALGLAWMTAACVNGYGGPVDWVIFTVCRTFEMMIVFKVLSLPPLRPLSRLTYAAYLVHPLVILFNYQVVFGLLGTRLPS